MLSGENLGLKKAVFTVTERKKHKAVQR